jgi:hemerythrin
MPGRQERRCAMQLIWKDNYNVGISLIDDQHRKLVDIINHLGFISSIGIGLPSLSGAIKELQTDMRRCWQMEILCFQAPY